MPGLRHILTCALAASLLTAAASAAQDKPSPRKGPAGSVAAQMRLKVQLKARAQGTSLAAALNHNRKEWEGLTPEQRDQYRRDVRAFLHKSPDEQERLLKHYDNLLKMPPKKRDEYRLRAQWVKVVLAHMTPEEQKNLSELPPGEKARTLADRRDELIRQGVDLDTPTPASAPTSGPAKGKPRPGK